MISLVGIIYLTSINYLEKGEFICSKLNLYYLKSALRKYCYTTDGEKLDSE